jgi:hypothetical protein
MCYLALWLLSTLVPRCSQYLPRATFCLQSTYVPTPTRAWYLPGICLVSLLSVPDSSQLSHSPASAADGLTEQLNNSLEPMLPPANRGHDRQASAPRCPAPRVDGLSFMALADSSGGRVFGAAPVDKGGGHTTWRLAVGDYSECQRQSCPL